MGADQLDLNYVRGHFWADDPHAALAWLREHDPVHWNEPAGVWGITGYDDVREISRRPEVWSSVGGIRPDSGPTGMMIEQDDPVHRQRRQLVSKGFHPTADTAPGRQGALDRRPPPRSGGRPGASATSSPTSPRGSRW